MAAPKLHQATAIIDVALAEARKKHFAPLGVAVLDAGGHLEASKREESNLIPTDARGGSARVGELIRRGLVSPEMTSLGQTDRTLARRTGCATILLMPTSLQRLLGIDLPIIQAPMAGSQGSALAIAVSNAGGLGSLAAASLSLEALRSELTTIITQTSGPYNVNFFCHIPPVPDPGREAAWRAALLPYYLELGLEATAAPAGSMRQPFSAEMADVLEAFRPPVVSFHFGLPAPELLARVKAWGPKVLSSATTVDEARWLEARGVDAIIAQGLEAGGHRGMFLSNDLSTQLGTFALVPQIARAVDVPIIAAGGIASAQGVAAASMLGAAGAQIGTAYLLCPEASTSAVHRAALKGDGSDHTAVTNVFTGRPARGILNRIMRELGPISPIAPAFPLAAGAVAPLRAQAERAGSSAFSPLWAGQNTTGCAEIPAAEITRTLADDSPSPHRVK